MFKNKILIWIVYEELKKQEFDMRNFVYKKAIEFTNKYEDHLEQVIIKYNIYYNQ